MEKNDVKSQTISKRVIISEEENGSAGNIQAKSHTKLYIAAYDDVTGDLIPLDNINLGIKIIKPSIWSFVPVISKNAKRYVEINHTFNSPYIVDNHEDEHLDNPIIKRI